MRRRFLLAVLIGALFVLAPAGPHLQPGERSPVAALTERPFLFFQPTVHAQHIVTFETITIANVSIGLTAATYQNMQGCSGRLETAEVRYRYDGVAPTASVGTLLEPLETVVISRVQDAQFIRFIRTTGTSGTLTVQCWSAAH